MPSQALHSSNHVYHQPLVLLLLRGLETSIPHSLVRHHIKIRHFLTPSRGARKCRHYHHTRPSACCHVNLQQHAKAMLGRDDSRAISCLTNLVLLLNTHTFTVPHTENMQCARVHERPSSVPLALRQAIACPCTCHSFEKTTRTHIHEVVTS